MKRCIAITLDGRPCGAFSFFWDRIRCGPVCCRHSRSSLGAELLSVLEAIAEAQAQDHPGSPGRGREVILRARSGH